MNITSKFIIFGGKLLFDPTCAYHRELVPKNTAKYQRVAGGGVITIDNENGKIIIEGESYDFGMASPDAVRMIFRKDHEDIINTLEMINETRGETDDLKNYKIYIYGKEV